MNQTIYIIDDDPSVRRVLCKIIEKNHLGKVVGQGEGKINTVKEIQAMKPDLVLVDLLMPSIDGIELVEIMKSIHPSVRILMISQVSSKEMIEKAYTVGVDFYVQKPVNVIEITNIIKNIYRLSGPQAPQAKSKEEYLESILSELGIMGQTGVEDLMMVVMHLHRNKKKLTSYKLQDLYLFIQNAYENMGEDIRMSTVEQRLRRLTQSALINLAHMGIEDFMHPIFEKYSSKLFDFAEVRQEMNRIKGTVHHPGKVSVKKFIDALETFL